jgi:hypothetical protein
VIRLRAAALGVLLLSSPTPAAWGGCVAVYSPSYVQTLERASRMHYEPRNALPSNVTTTSQCESWLKSQSIWSTDAGYRQTTCDCGGSSSGGSGYTPNLGPGATIQQQVAATIIGAMFASAFAPPPAGPSPEETARKNAEAEEARRRAEEEARRRAAEEARKQALAKEQRLAQAALMMGPDGVPTSAGTQRVAGWKGLDVDPAPPSESSRLAMLSPRPTARMTTMERLRCASALSEASRQYSGTRGPEAAEKTRFYAQQAESVAAGQPIEVDCPASPSDSSIPEASPPMRVSDPPPTLAEIQEYAAADRVSLDNVSARLQGLADRRQKIEERKVEAAKKIPAPTVDTAAAVDPLVAQAEALLRESEAELAGVERDEKALLEEKTRLAESLAGHEAQARLYSDKAGK